MERESMQNRAIDRYSLELDAPAENTEAGRAVRCVATNTDDNSTAEAWLTLEQTRALLNFACGNEQSIVDSWLQQLEDHHYADLIGQQGASKPSRCIFNSTELVQFGFSQDELRPWRNEVES
jgi:hypothetical protein